MRKLALSFALLTVLNVSDAFGASYVISGSEDRDAMTMSIFQEPNGFIEKFNEISNGSISSKQDWSSFWDADIWVYFLTSPDEIERLGKYELAIYDRSSGASDETFMTLVEVTLGGGKDVVVYFFFASSLDDATFSEIGNCKAVHSIWERVLNGVRTDTDRAKMRECD